MTSKYFLPSNSVGSLFRKLQAALLTLISLKSLSIMNTKLEMALKNFSNSSKLACLVMPFNVNEKPTTIHPFFNLYFLLN